MAEARQAVGFRLGVTPDGGIHFEYDQDVFDLIVKSFKRTWNKSVARFANGLKTGIFPVKAELFSANCLLLFAIFLSGYDPTFGITHTLTSWLNITEGILWISSCILAAILTTLFWTGVIRFTLRLLFSYQAWMYMSREQLKSPSMIFKFWASLVGALCSLRRLGSTTKTGKPLLLAYQGALPTLPLPSVKDTLRRHLESIKPLTNAEEYQEFVQLSQNFETTLGNKLQRWLQLKWWTSDNYVSDWWEEYVYLRGRSPLMINSNYYCIDSMKTITHVQAARAANVVNLAFQFRRLLLKQEATPIVVQGLVPMCSRQYDRFFNTTRIPGVETDTLLHLNDATHIVCMHKGRYFRLCVYNKGRLLNSAELQKQIQGILDDPSEPDEGEKHLAALTASDRKVWAETRNSYFNKGLNKTSLDIIERSAFVLVLDDYAYGYNDEDESQASHYGRMMLHGKCSDRWFDKSFQLIVGNNGKMGLNGEHSWADAPVVAHFWEYLIAKDIVDGNSYDSEGNCVGRIMDVPPKARKLRWDIPESCKNTIDSCLKEAQLLADDLQLHILHHNVYGKGFVKKCKLSPDAYIQMALQLAYYRDAGKFCLTYESSMTRLFREGRTETVRPCTLESAAFVKIMEDPNEKTENKVKALKEACSRHVTGIQDAMTGKGIDRHLFALYVISRYLNEDSQFLKRVLSEPWRLSTSQTPVRGEYSDPNKSPGLMAAGGGFGPVADDGYGVSYIINGENTIFFHVSAKKKCPKTDAYRFAKTIEKAMADLRDLHENLEAEILHSKEDKENRNLTEENAKISS